jgi:uncharacterized membrane protein YedE/YeeE
MQGGFSGRAALAAASVLAAAAWLGASFGWRQGAALILGALLGLVLFHAAFGFAGAFRRLLAEGRGAGLRAQMAMLGIAVLLFLPALELGEVFGQPVRGFVFPVGLGLAVGAFLFGIGMQLGGGCGSGTLYTAGGGQGSRMWITLAAFVAGATFAAWDAERWMAWPALPPVSLPDALGLVPALVLSLGIFVMVWWVSAAIERRRHGHAEPLPWRGGRLLAGPWPLLWGAAGLAVLNFATLIVIGRPWAITAAFPLWGSQLVEATGWDDPAFWPFWEDPTRTEALLRPILADRTTAMDFGVMAGAALAALLAGGRGVRWRLPAAGPALGSLCGGLLLGYGAVLGFGCNISAYFGGIASGSLHGWAWILPALAGNAVGLWLRPAFGLARPAG